MIRSASRQIYRNEFAQRVPTVFRRTEFISLCLLIVLLHTSALAANNLGNIGTFHRWSKIEIVLNGPTSVGGGDPNPFAVFVDVEFVGPSGQIYNVPGFYDGDGAGGLDGSVWKVLFSADENGPWTFRSNSSDSRLHNHTGSFSVKNPAAGAPEFYRWGRLEYNGTPANKLRYLKFRDGPYWLKAGSDDPENLLGTMTNYDTPLKRKAAIDYLASKGINSQYLVTHNIDGDHRDVWPWLGSNESEARSNGGNNARFDLAKLAEWQDLFEHMQTKGVAVYIVLEDDSAWTGYDHKQYYREMIARYGYLPALLFNIGEEANENYSIRDALELAQMLKDIDPYDHPVGIHNVNTPRQEYVDATQVDFASIQTNGNEATKHNQIAAGWIDASRSRNKRVLVVGFDEPRPLMDRGGWWSAYIGGAVWEVHVSRPYDQPIATWEPAWTRIGGARAFMETLPFWDMEPNNSLVTTGEAFVLAKPGEAYALYLPSGGSIAVDLAPGSYHYGWWDPTNDRWGVFQNGGSISGGNQKFAPPGQGDWALRIVKR